MIKYIVLLIAIMLGAIGQLLLKLGIKKINFTNIDLKSFDNILQIFIALLKNYYIIITILLYIIGFCLYLYLLSNFELSKLLPFTSLLYIIILLFSWIFLNEAISSTKIIGTIIIMAGVYIVAIS
ncbi:EamA family transporter [Candidatus Parcubacteria bacterium]|nr:EamA family transporter [Candidatus Parcubacteria bacterium]